VWFLLIWISTGCYRGASDIGLGTEPPVSEAEVVFQKGDTSRILPRITQEIDNITVTLEIVKEKEDVERGLMFRDSLEANSGMLFVFPKDDLYPFWMKNTYIPLSIAFLTADGIVAGIDEMIALDTVTRHVPDVPYRYAIEMNSGWFKAHGVKVGDTLKPPKLP